jgi:hypothetical protein
MIPEKTDLHLERMCLSQNMGVKKKRLNILSVWENIGIGFMIVELNLMR